MQHSDEQQLIAAAKAGSATAFAELVVQYRVRLLRFLLTRSASFADAEDALQDTLLSAFRYLHTYDERWRFSTWIYRIAIRNVLLNPHSPSTDIDELVSIEDDPLVACIRHSESENLWVQARSHLNDDMFNAMWLRYAEDLSINDIAHALDRSVSWTKVNLLRARRSLEAAMNDSAGEDKAYG